MYSTDGHQLVVNDYYEECLRKAKEREAERDNLAKRVQDGNTASARPSVQPARVP